MTAVRGRQKARTRRRLLQAALRLFARKGILATRTLDVARAARVSHGAVFVHFPTRDEMVAAVIEELGLRMTRRLHEHAERKAGVRQILAAHLAGLQEYETLYTRLITEGPVLPAYARSTLVGIQSAIAHHLADAVHREIAAGTIRRMELPLLFNTWLGLVHHYLVNRDLFAPGEFVLARRGKDILGHFMRLLAP
jgi:AcrR family transcriptional regulator